MFPTIIEGNGTLMTLGTSRISRRQICANRQNCDFSVLSSRYARTGKALCRNSRYRPQHRSVEINILRPGAPWKSVCVFPLNDIFINSIAKLGVWAKCSAKRVSFDHLDQNTSIKTTNEYRSKILRDTRFASNRSKVVFKKDGVFQWVTIMVRGL